MNTVFRLLLCAAIAACTGCTHFPAADRAPDRTAASEPAPLLLISIDAYRYDYIDRGLSPNLEMLARHGVQAASMQPSFPSLTFPNHYTLVTGLRPDHHGIVDNTMFDPHLGKFSLGNRKAVSDGRWWDEATPIWVTADQHGMRTATMFWPGSEAAIHGHRPDYWRPFDDSVSADQRVDQVLAWLDLPPATRPRFLTLYFDAVDHAGHKHGHDATFEEDYALAQAAYAVHGHEHGDHGHKHEHGHDHRHDHDHAAGHGHGHGHGHGGHHDANPNRPDGSGDTSR